MKLYYVRNLSNEVVTLKDNYQVVLSLQPAGQPDDREPVSILAISRSDFQSYWAAGFLAVYADPAYTVVITRSSDLSEALSDGDIDERILAVGNATYAPAFASTTTIAYSGDNVASVTENGITTTYTYNGDGTVHTDTRAGVTRTYTYDGSGNLTGIAS
jgi:uncharacterized protein RhaS with RHS repeats